MVEVDIPLPRQVYVCVVPLTSVTVETPVSTEMAAVPSEYVENVVAPDAVLRPLVPFESSVWSTLPDETVREVVPFEHAVTVTDGDG